MLKHNRGPARFYHTTLYKCRLGDSSTDSIIKNYPRVIPKCNTSKLSPFHACAKLCVLVAASAGYQCGDCETNVSYFAHDNDVVRKRRPPKSHELSSKRKTHGTFQLFEQVRPRTTKHKKQFIADSGATISCTSKPDWFESIEEYHPKLAVHTAGGQIINPTFKGTAQ